MIRISRGRQRAGDLNDAHSESPDEESSADRADETSQAEAEIADGVEADPGVVDAQEDSLTQPEPGAAGPMAESAGARWQRVVAYGLLPALAMLVAGGAGYRKWLQTGARETQSARIESVQAATESTIKILSYGPDSVDRDLDAARDRLTGTFRDAYTQLTRDVVIPGSKQKKIQA